MKNHCVMQLYDAAYRYWAFPQSRKYYELYMRELRQEGSKMDAQPRAAKGDTGALTDYVSCVTLITRVTVYQEVPMKRMLQNMSDALADAALLESGVGPGNLRENRGKCQP